MRLGWRNLTDPYAHQDTYYVAMASPAQIILRCLIAFGPAILLAGIVLWRTREKGIRDGLTIAVCGLLLPILYLVWTGWATISDIFRFGGEVGLFLIGEAFSVASLLVPWILFLALGFVVGRHQYRRRMAVQSAVKSFE
jgi:hypothetical protein